MGRIVTIDAGLPQPLFGQGNCSPRDYVKAFATALNLVLALVPTA